MRRWLLLILALSAIAAMVAGGVWAYARRDRLEWQYACHQVGAAETFEQAQSQIAQFETEPQRDAKLRELVAAWGTGNQRFDAYLARHIDSPQCGDALRQAFSLEFSWRPDLLPRWAHYWSWRVAGAPAEEAAGIRNYLKTLATADPPRQITWREVLDLQAVFELSGQRRLAVRLKPDNWKGRYLRWIETEASWPKAIERPRRPFPDWQGPVNL